jgi:glycosyltransferase involved in cell wall biosynthesis
MIKVLTMHYTVKRGGAYDRFKMMMEALLEGGCEVHCLSLTPIFIRHPFYHNHLPWVPCPMRNGFVSKLIVLVLFPFYSLLIGWREKIDLVVAFGPLYALLLAIPKHILRKPMTMLIRSDSPLGLKQSLSDSFPLSACFRWFERTVEYLGVASSDRILTINTAIKEDVIRMMRKPKGVRVEVLFNNITSMPGLGPDTFEMKRQIGIPEGGKILVTSGVLNPVKNFQTLIRILPSIGLKNTFLMVIGSASTQSDSQYGKALKKLAKDLGINERVIFTGWLEKEELWKIFRVADLFVLPSKREGMPNVLLEALGFNLSCIGSNIPGIRDILKYDELMFDPWDEKALASKVDRLFSDAQYFYHVNKLCQERKEDFIFDWKERVFQFATGGILK